MSGHNLFIHNFSRFCCFRLCLIYSFQYWFEPVMKIFRTGHGPAKKRWKKQDQTKLLFTINMSLRTLRISVFMKVFVLWFHMSHAILFLLINLFSFSLTHIDLLSEVTQRTTASDSLRIMTHSWTFSFVTLA